MSDAAKKIAALEALKLVEPGMRLGLGTGSTAAHFIVALGARAVAEGFSPLCAATSKASAELARAHGLKVVDPDEIGEIDLAIDGADEADPALNLIKGAGAALLREKVIAAAAARFVVIADQTKKVARLGRFPLPVEALAFGIGFTAKACAAAAHAAGCPVSQALLRVRNGAPVITDNGNLILDLACTDIPDAEDLAERLDAIPGVLGHGLFLGLAERLILGSDAGALTLFPQR